MCMSQTGAITGSKNLTVRVHIWRNGAVWETVTGSLTTLMEWQWTVAAVFMPRIRTITGSKNLCHDLQTRFLSFDNTAYKNTAGLPNKAARHDDRSEEHTSEL